MDFQVVADIVLGDCAKLPVPEPRRDKEKGREGDHIKPRYETIDNVDELKLVQHEENIVAYILDYKWSMEQLETGALDDQEVRKFQLRMLDTAHQARWSHQQAEIYRFQGYGVGGQELPVKNRTIPAKKRAAPSSRTTGGPSKRVKISEKTTAKTANKANAPTETPEAESENGSSEAIATKTVASSSKASSSNHEVQSEDGVTIPSDTDDDDGEDDVYEVPNPDHHEIINKLQRTGVWHCHLCKSERYHNVGPNRRTPTMPNKLPLHDVAKIIAHYLTSHTEHKPHERLEALGAALAVNPGPFEYWVTRSKKQHQIKTREIQHCIRLLQDGELPDLLMNLHSGAASFPDED